MSAEVHVEKKVLKASEQDRPDVALIPSAAVIVRTGGPRVAVVDENEQVRYREVKLGRDLGEEVEVLDGVVAGQRVIVYPGDDLPEGPTVVAEATPEI